jgi:membrane-associated protease RseP (regulator of RpoE activity)
LLPRVPFIVDTVMADGSALAAGMQKGDILVAVDNVVTKYYTDLREAMADRKGKEVTVKVQRSNALLELHRMTVTEEGTVGIGNRAPSSLLHHGPRGVQRHLGDTRRHCLRTGRPLGGYVRSLKLLFSRSGASQIGRLRVHRWPVQPHVGLAGVLEHDGTSSASSWLS